MIILIVVVEAIRRGEVERSIDCDRVLNVHLDRLTERPPTQARLGGQLLTYPLEGLQN